MRGVPSVRRERWGGSAVDVDMHVNRRSLAGSQFSSSGGRKHRVRAGSRSSPPGVIAIAIAFLRNGVQPVGGADPFGVLIVALLGLRNFFVRGDVEIGHSGSLDTGFRARGIG